MAEPPQDAALWTSAEIAAATGGRHDGAPFDVYGIGFDSRAIAPGDLFVALAGERDGHGFVEAARAKGAVGVLVSQPVHGPAVVVDDTLKALERLGEAARDRTVQAKRAAVTGSVGKTSVTQAIAAGLRIAGKAHSSVESFNNHIGVPLTLARMPRDTERAVFEIGMNHAGEIGPLSRMVRPDVAVVTTVGAVHVENFPDGEAGVAKAKAEIFEGMAPGGVAILPAEDKWFELLSAAARAAGARVLTFGVNEGCDARLLTFEGLGAPSTASRCPSPMNGGGEEGAASLSSPAQRGRGTARSGVEGASVVATLHGKTLRFPIAQTGAHWGLNSLATVLAVEALGAPVEAGLEGLAGFTPLAGRGAEHVLPLPSGGSFTLIDESYNANPISVRAALATLKTRRAKGRKLVVLSDMLEIGEDAPAVHAALAGPIAQAGVDQVFLAGPAMRALWDVLPKAGRGGWAETAAELSPLVQAALRPGDVVMAKGSKGSKASLVVQDLLDRAPRAGSGEQVGVARK